MAVKKAKKEGGQEEVPKKALQTKGASEEEMEEMLEEAEEAEKELDEGKEAEKRNILIQASKPIAQVKKGDTIVIDGKPYTVDVHSVLMKHGNTKEMAIELFDKSDKDYQLRYFDDQIETTLELYELEEIMYVKKAMKSIAW